MVTSLFRYASANPCDLSLTQRVRKAYGVTRARNIMRHHIGSLGGLGTHFLAPFLLETGDKEHCSPH